MAGSILRFAKLTQNAIAPTKGSKRAAGYDLYRFYWIILLSCKLLSLRKELYYSAYDYEIPAMGKMIVKTDIQIQLPHGCYGRVAPRSGLAANHHIDVGGNQLDGEQKNLQASN